MILLKLRCYYGDGVRPQPGHIQQWLQAPKQTYLLHCKKPAVSRGGAGATAHTSSALLISRINDCAAERAVNGEPGVFSHMTGDVSIPKGPSRSVTLRGRVVPRPSKARPGRCCTTAGEQRKVLGVKRNKTCLFYPFQLHAGLGDRSGFLLCAWTTKKPN